MILSIICDQCEEAIAAHVVFETKWKQVALCGACHDETVDHTTIYRCAILSPNLKATIRSIVKENPAATTAQIVTHVLDDYVHPVFLPPWDSQVKEALRDRTCFRPVKITPGSTALSYEVVEEDDPR